MAAVKKLRLPEDLLRVSEAVFVRTDFFRVLNDL